MDSNDLLHRASRAFYTAIDHILSSYTGDAEVNEVFNRLKTISHAYHKPKSTDKEPNFDDKYYRVAYLYEYFPMYSFAAYKILQEFLPKIKKWFPQASKECSLNVCCIGGGPGTELLALVKFLSDYDMLPAKLMCTILDAHSDWEQTWKEIWGKSHLGLPDGFKLLVQYVEFDLLEDQITEGVLQAIKTADIVTTTMTFSRLVQRPPTEDEECRLKELYREMKAQSLMLYFDTTRYDINFIFATKFRELFPLVKEECKLENYLVNTEEGALFQDFPNMKQIYLTCKYSQMTSHELTALLLKIRV